ncbi:hypothetical protein D3C80_1625780 [compost metagenome]
MRNLRLNWLQHSHDATDYLDVRGDRARKGAEKQEGAQGSPKRYSDAFCCFVFIAKHGHILFPSPLRGNTPAVIGFKFLLNLRTIFHRRRQHSRTENPFQS